MRASIVFLAIFFGFCLQAKADVTEIYVDKKTLLHAVVKNENPQEEKWLIGDKHLSHKAIGPLQIRKPCLSDVNYFIGKEVIRKKWGKKRLAMYDMWEQDKAEWVCLAYVAFWGKVYTKETGKIPTLEVYARIFNGGPNGWKKKTTHAYGVSATYYAKMLKKAKEKPSPEI